MGLPPNRSGGLPPHTQALLGAMGGQGSIQLTRHIINGYAVSEIYCKDLKELEVVVYGLCIGSRPIQVNIDSTTIQGFEVNQSTEGDLKLPGSYRI